MTVRLPKCTSEKCTDLSIDRNSDMPVAKGSYHFVETRRLAEEPRFSLSSDGMPEGTFVLCAKVPNRTSRALVDRVLKQMIGLCAQYDDIGKPVGNRGDGSAAIGETFFTHAPDCEISKAMKSSFRNNSVLFGSIG